MLKIILGSILIILLLIPNAFGVEKNYQFDSTTNNKLDVLFFTVPEHPNIGDETKLKIEFLKHNTKTVQEDIDFTVAIEKSINRFIKTNLSHTSTGSVTIPFEFDEGGLYDVIVDVHGILFSPIPTERATFSVQIGQKVPEYGFEHTKDVSIPIWVKNNAGWWANDQIGDADFISGIQYLITNGIMNIPETQSEQSNGQDIPNWIKNNAEWWYEDKIGDSDFISGIQYLISNGVISV